MQKSSKKAFSLIELSIVILVIGILVAGVTQSSRLLKSFRIQTAQTLTQSSPVAGIKDLELWLEASQENSFDDSEQEDESPVTTWYDINPQSPSKQNAVQSTAASQPKYISECINNIPCVRFDGSNDVLVSSLDINYTKLPNITIFVVFRYSGDGVNANEALFGNDDGSWDRFVLTEHTTLNASISNGSSTQAFSALGIENTPQIFSLTLKNGVSNGSKAFMNGQESSVTFTEGHYNLGENSTSIGALRESGELSMGGEISEFIVYSRALKNEERQSIENYLGQKYGIEITK